MLVINALFALVVDNDQPIFHLTHTMSIDIDRPPNIKDQSHGGVLIAIKKDVVSSEITELKTNCEIVWAEINIAGSKNLQIASYYRPPPDKGQALEQIQSAINRINRQSNSTVIIGGDFNLGHID